MKSTLHTLYSISHTGVHKGSILIASKNAYATHRVCNPDNSYKDNLALKNNPIVMSKKTGKTTRHVEVTRRECKEDQACKTKICKSLCGTLKDEKSTGHLSHGNVNNAQGTSVTLSRQDASGNNQEQRFFAYSQPHQTSQNQTEIPQATTYVKQSHIESIIDKVENKT